MIFITDPRSGSQIVLYPENHTYSAVKAPLAGSVQPYCEAADEKFTETNSTKLMLGYLVRLFKIKAKSEGSTVTGYAWFAPGVPEPPGFGKNKLLALPIGPTYIGFPLAGSADTISKKYNIKTSVDWTVTKISTIPVPSSAFSIPSGYTQSSGLR